MPYNRTNVKHVKDAFRVKKLKAEENAESRKAALRDKFPRIAQIDKELGLTGIRIFEESFKGRDGIEDRIAALRKHTESLRKERAAILEEAGLPEDYDEPHYDCTVCGDTGYDKDGKPCECFMKALAEECFRNSGLSKLISKQNFENFSLDYYSGSEKSKMENILSAAKEFADAFGDGENENLLFMGSTGLGKTHLSSAVAKCVISKGYDVIYESAQNIFSDFEKKQFSKNEESASIDTDKYFDCDLLIIDDLGTEISNQFTVSCLYNLVNTRLVNEKSMIISTNISKDEIFERYSDRITSRLFGEFMPCVFTGTDNRYKKLQRK